MSTDVLNNLREAIDKAEGEELRIADCLSAMVCERDHKDVSRAGTFGETASLLQTQLFDMQRTVDVLKLSLARASKKVGVAPVAAVDQLSPPATICTVPRTVGTATWTAGISRSSATPSSSVSSRTSRSPGVGRARAPRRTRTSSGTSRRGRRNPRTRCSSGAT